MSSLKDKAEQAADEQDVEFPQAEKAILASSTDFRSDTITTPTPSMLSSILAIPLHGDDVYREDPTTASLESFMAKLTNKPSALFVLSGTMANQLSLRSHLTQPPHSILCDHRAHIYVYEAGGTSVISQAMITPVVPSNKYHLTAKDIEKAAILDQDIHSAPTAVISLENSLGGSIMPLSEVRRIRQFANQHGIKMHLDGARLWNVVAAEAGTLPEYCAEFDSVSLCFSKGLGAPVGSVIVGEEKFIDRARWFRKMLGGGTRQSGIMTGPARVAVEEVFLGGQLVRSHELAKRIEKKWKELGGVVKYPCETNMVWLDLVGRGVDIDAFVTEAKHVGLRLGGERVVIHHQISEEAIEKLETVMGKMVGRASDDTESKDQRSKSIYATSIQ